MWRDEGAKPELIQIITVIRDNIIADAVDAANEYSKVVLRFVVIIVKKKTQDADEG